MLSFVREDEDDKVFAAFNFSAQQRTVSFDTGPQRGAYVDALTGEPAAAETVTTMTLPAWGYRVLVR